MSAADCPAPGVRVEKRNLAELQTTIHALGGIFWALNMLVVDGVADEAANDEDRTNGIAGLIIAGELLSGEVAERF